MITLTFAFWLFVILFAIIGAMRGWAKELLVTFAVVLGLFMIAVMERFVPGSIRQFLLGTDAPQFWVRTIIVFVLVIFGYQTPNLPRVPAARFTRDRFSDALLGFFLGALNGYLIVGTIWYFMDISKYPFKPYITPPAETVALLKYLPPKWLLANNSPFIYFAVAIAFLFVLVVFI